MKTPKSLLVIVSLIMPAIFLTSGAYADFRITLEKDVIKSEMAGWPNEVTFCIYDSVTALTPVACQTFSNGEWTADFKIKKYTTEGQKKNIVRFRVNFTNTEDLTMEMEDLWVGIELDGKIVGDGERVKNAAWAMFSHDTEIPSGMITMFDSHCPSNWTRVGELDDRFPMGGSVFGFTGGFRTHTHTGTTEITEQGVDLSSTPGDAKAARDHLHPFTTDSASSLPPFVTVVFCKKN